MGRLRDQLLLPEDQITNSHIVRGKMAFVKVDKDSWGGDGASATKLGGAAFTLTTIDETKAVMEGD